MVIKELLEDPVLPELEKCDVLAPLYHIEGIGLHICFQRNTAISVLSGVCAPDLRGREGRVRGGGGTCQDRTKKTPAATAEISWQAALMHIVLPCPEDLAVFDSWQGRFGHVGQGEFRHAVL